MNTLRLCVTKLYEVHCTLDVTKYWRVNRVNLRFKYSRKKYKYSPSISGTIGSATYHQSQPCPNHRCRFPQSSYPVPCPSVGRRVPAGFHADTSSGYSRFLASKSIITSAPTSGLHLISDVVKRNFIRFRSQCGKI